MLSLELSTAEMDGDSCCFISTTFPLLFLRFCLQTEFLSDNTQILYILYLFLVFFYLLPSSPIPALTLLWALINLDWFPLHTFFDLIHFVSLSRLTLSSSTEDTLRKVVISDLWFSPIMILLKRYPPGRASAHTRDLRARQHVERSGRRGLFLLSCNPLMSCNNLIERTPCSHAPMGA